MTLDEVCAAAKKIDIKGEVRSESKGLIEFFVRTYSSTEPAQRALGSVTGNHFAEQQYSADVSEAITFVKRLLGKNKADLNATSISVKQTGAPLKGAALKKMVIEAFGITPAAANRRRRPAQKAEAKVSAAVASPPPGEEALGAEPAVSSGEAGGLRPLFTLKDLQMVPSRIALSHSGEVISCDSYDDNIHLWSGADGSPLKGLKQRSSASWAFSSDGRYVASGAKTITVTDLSTGKALVKCKGHKHQVNALLFSLDGKALFSASGTGVRGADLSVRRWDLQDGTCVLTRKLPSIGWDVAHSGANQLLVKCADRAMLLNASTLETIAEHLIDEGAGLEAAEAGTAFCVSEKLDRVTLLDLARGSSSDYPHPLSAITSVTTYQLDGTSTTSETPTLEAFNPFCELHYHAGAETWLYSDIDAYHLIQGTSLHTILCDFGKRSITLCANGKRLAFLREEGGAHEIHVWAR